MATRPDGARVFGAVRAGNPVGMSSRVPEEEQGVSGAGRAAARGLSDRTPFIAIGGVALVVFTFAALVVLTIFLIWQFV
jgi:hypothetical protein